MARWSVSVEKLTEIHFQPAHHLWWPGLLLSGVDRLVPVRDRRPGHHYQQWIKKISDHAQDAVLKTFDVTRFLVRDVTLLYKIQLIGLIFFFKIKMVPSSKWPEGPWGGYSSLKIWQKKSKSLFFLPLELELGHSDFYFSFPSFKKTLLLYSRLIMD